MPKKGISEEITLVEVMREIRNLAARLDGLGQQVQVVSDTVAQTNQPFLNPLNPIVSNLTQLMPLLWLGGAASGANKEGANPLLNPSLGNTPATPMGAPPTPPLNQGRDPPPPKKKASRTAWDKYNLDGHYTRSNGTKIWVHNHLVFMDDKAFYPIRRKGSTWHMSDWQVHDINVGPKGELKVVKWVNADGETVEWNWSTSQGTTVFEKQMVKLFSEPYPETAGRLNLSGKFTSHHGASVSVGADLSVRLANVAHGGIVRNKYGRYSFAGWELDVAHSDADHLFWTQNGQIIIWKRVGNRLNKSPVKKTAAPSKPNTRKIKSIKTGGTKTRRRQSLPSSTPPKKKTKSQLPEDIPSPPSSPYSDARDPLSYDYDIDHYNTINEDYYRDALAEFGEVEKLQESLDTFEPDSSHGELSQELHAPLASSPSGSVSEGLQDNMSLDEADQDHQPVTPLADRCESPTELHQVEAQKETQPPNEEETPDLAHGTDSGADNLAPDLNLPDFESFQVDLNLESLDHFREEMTDGFDQFQEVPVEEIPTDQPEEPHESLAPVLVDGPDNPENPLPLAL